MSVRRRTITLQLGECPRCGQQDGFTYSTNWIQNSKGMIKCRCGHYITHHPSTPDQMSVETEAAWNEQSPSKPEERRSLTLEIVPFFSHLH